MAEILKGAPVAAGINEKTIEQVKLLALSNITPTLAILRVGDREDDIYYEKAASKRCDSIGVLVRHVALPVSVTQEELMQTVSSLCEDETVHGILMMRPLPKHLDEEAVRKALCPEKDIDGITDASLAGVFTGSGIGFAPCTAQACIEMLDYYGINQKGKRAVVVGRSLVIGKPVSMLLLSRSATVTICHTKTNDMMAETLNADIIIAAAGKANVLTGEYLKEGQTVIDVGVNVAEDGSICGDVLFDDAVKKVSAITPVPGGVGTVTTSVLVNHVVEAALKTL